ncbi:unnamed protein product [Clonostachys rosea]|uniref:Uncharacterized protein n=1 Tax=Bionectria ochroleuca TaxID=29856 RepID=A0ABY6UFZ7_BIOOC|nr:unnamed protein product [Clonostachys rosea]
MQCMSEDYTCPAWNYRILKIVEAPEEEYREVQPEDVDEDISDLDSQGDQSSSEDDFDGGDIDYLDLREQREERKLQLRAMGEIEEQELVGEQEMMDKVDAIHENLKLALENGADPKPLN